MKTDAVICMAFTKTILSLIPDSSRHLSTCPIMSTKSLRVDFSNNNSLRYYFIILFFEFYIANDFQMGGPIFAVNTFTLNLISLKKFYWYSYFSIGISCEKDEKLSL